MTSDANYICPTCGEDIVVAIDASAGPTQEYVEDCPVCCRANVLRVTMEAGEVRVTAEPE